MVANISGKLIILVSKKQEWEQPLASYAKKNFYLQNQDK